MSDGSAILLTAAGTLVGVVLGAVPSWYFSRRYYLRGGSDLDAALRPLAGDDQKLLQATNAVGRMLEQAGIGKPSYDQAGNITGIVVTATAHARGSSTATAIGSFTITPPPRYDRQHEQPELEKQDSHDA